MCGAKSYISFGGTDITKTLSVIFHLSLWKKKQHELKLYIAIFCCWKFLWHRGCTVLFELNFSLVQTEPHLPESCPLQHQIMVLYLSFNHSLAFTYTFLFLNLSLLTEVIFLGPCSCRSSFTDIIVNLIGT